MGYTEARIIVFVKVADEHVKAVGELLEGIKQPHKYFFSVFSHWKPSSLPGNRLSN